MQACQPWSIARDIVGQEDPIGSQSKISLQPRGIEVSGSLFIMLDQTWPEKEHVKNKWSRDSGARPQSRQVGSTSKPHASIRLKVGFLSRTKSHVVVECFGIATQFQTKLFHETYGFVSRIWFHTCLALNEQQTRPSTDHIGKSDADEIIMEDMYEKTSTWRSDRAGGRNQL